jgi:adenosylhomocysteine nucleosidase
MLVFIAAEAREFDGILRRAARSTSMRTPIAFCRKVLWKDEEIVLMANGPGRELAGAAAGFARESQPLGAMVSFGFCGALDPALEPGDVFVASEVLGSGTALLPRTNRAYRTGSLVSIDHVAVNAAEKAELARTGAAAVDMEAGILAARAHEWKVPFFCIRAVTDTADESFALDFNRMRDKEGRFSRAKIVKAAMRRPGVLVPELRKLDRRCRQASEALGEFVDNCRFDN